MLTVIYSPNIENLEKFKTKATHWLPENLDTTKEFYHLGDVICTTKFTSLEMLKTLVLSGKISHFDVVFIDASNLNDITAHTFNGHGYINNFFNIK